MKNKRYFKFVSLVTIFIVSITSLVGCGGSQNETTSSNTDKKSEITIGISAEPSTIDPHIQSGTATRLIKQNIYRGLVQYKQDSTIGLELAESYKISDDGLTYTFNIKPEAKFHDGSDVKAEDVKFSIERIMDEKTGATFGTDFRNVVDRCEVVNDKTVNIILKKPCTSFIDMLALPESAIVSKSWCESHNNDLNSNPMGNGPYKFDSWDKGREIVVTAFDKYYKASKPETKSIKFVFSTDETTRVNSLRSGEFDIVDYVSSKNVISLESEENVEVQNSIAPIMLLQFNCKEGPLSDPRVRQAISYAIDRDGVINAAFMGRGKAIYGFPTLVGQNGYDGKYDNYFSYNLDKAKQLLAEAGYPNGFSTKLLATSTYEMHKQTALVVQDSLKKIGIEVEVELPDWSTRIERSNKGDYGILVSGTTGNIVDMDWCTNYFLSGEPRMNSSAWFADAKIDELLEKGRTTLDPDERAKIYDQFRERALELSPFVFINYREQSFAISKAVHEFKNLDGILTYYSGSTLENTYVDNK
ncbi:MAG: ABC transporter substrate-binding protein [Clostridium beijerinckii]